MPRAHQQPPLRQAMLEVAMASHRLQLVAVLVELKPVSPLLRANGSGSTHASHERKDVGQ